jgi:hypothetical protein
MRGRSALTGWRFGAAIRYSTRMPANATKSPRQYWVDFLDSVERAREELGSPNVIWYRGHSNAAWKLLPTLVRFQNGYDLEQEAFHEFKRAGARLFAKRDNDWEILFDMQHYWIPTRLLDWTESLGVAIAFIAFTQYQGDEDSVLYILDPAALNRRSGLNEIKRVPDDVEFGYRRIYWEKKPFAPRYPIAAIPTMQSDRLFAQRGVFTIHGDDPSPVEALCPEAVKRVILTRAAKPAAREFVEYANLNEYTIYPDIVGMAGHIRKKLFHI